MNRGDVTDEFIKDFGSRWILQQTQTRHQRASWIEAARGGSYFWGLTWVSGRAPVKATKRTLSPVARRKCWQGFAFSSIERTLTFVGEYGDFIPYLDEAHFNQRPKIIQIDRRQFCPLAFDITQHPAKMYRCPVASPADPSFPLRLLSKHNGSLQISPSLKCQSSARCDRVFSATGRLRLAATE